MDQANILVVEDDDIVALTIERCLRREDYRVTLANSGVEGLQQARRHKPELVILDVIMPGLDGFAVCREMRADPILSDVPILFLTARAKPEDRITGFNVGADDYLVKPFNLDELTLRVRAILRRTKKPAPAQSDSTNEAHQVDQKRVEAQNSSFCISIKGYILDSRTFELSIPGKDVIRLTPIQFDLLYHLMSHPGEVFSPARLLDEVWDYPSDAGSPDLVRVHIKNLRERVELDPRSPAFIETVPGFGYTIRESPENPS